jgi:hypothetical protein
MICFGVRLIVPFSFLPFSAWLIHFVSLRLVSVVASETERNPSTTRSCANRQKRNGEGHAPVFLSRPTAWVASADVLRRSSVTRPAVCRWPGHGDSRCRPHPVPQGDGCRPYLRGEPKRAEAGSCRPRSDTPKRAGDRVRRELVNFVYHSVVIP